MTVLSIFSKNNSKRIFLDKNDNALQKCSKNGIGEKCGRLTALTHPQLLLSDLLMVFQDRAFWD
jgi:hypothetical protein